MSQRVFVEARGAEEHSNNQKARKPIPQNAPTSIRFPDYLFSRDEGEVNRVPVSVPGGSQGRRTLGQPEDS